MSKKPTSYLRKKAFELAENTAASKPMVSPDATQGPDASFESIQELWMGIDSTNAPSIGEIEPEPKYAAGGAALLDKFLQGRIPLPTRSVFILLTLAWFGILSFLFVKDSELGRLEAIAGLQWFGIKALLYTGFYVIVAIIILIASRALGKSMTPLKKVSQGLTRAKRGHTELKNK